MLLLPPRKRRRRLGSRVERALLWTPPRAHRLMEGCTPRPNGCWRRERCFRVPSYLLLLLLLLTLSFLPLSHEAGARAQAVFTASRLSMLGCPSSLSTNSPPLPCLPPYPLLLLPIASPALVFSRSHCAPSIPIPSPHLLSRSHLGRQGHPYGAEAPQGAGQGSGCQAAAEGPREGPAAAGWLREVCAPQDGQGKPRGRGVAPAGPGPGAPGRD